MLKLNREKFEYILFHLRHQYLNPQNFALLIGDTTFMPTNHVRKLRCSPGTPRSLTMGKHISPITKACYYQIRCISRIRKFITTGACRSLSVAVHGDFQNGLCQYPASWRAKDSAQQAPTATKHLRPPCKQNTEKRTHNASFNRIALGPSGIQNGV